MKELCIAYSVSVAGDLLPHLKEHNFCEADEVGEVFRHTEKEIWVSVYEEWGLGSLCRIEHQLLFYKASVLEVGKMC